MTRRKGIILAGGTGSRLWPITLAVSKQLLPVYDKPMIYYPLSTLMYAGLRDIAIITTPEDQPQFRRLLGSGSQWGIKLSYIIQPTPDGLAQALVLAEDFLDGAPSAMILGDNIFHGHGLRDALARADERENGATIFGHHVQDPQRYGVAAFDSVGRVIRIDEKPRVPASNYAVTGLYFFDETASARAREVKPSSRGELEIVSVLQSYLADDTLAFERLGRGFVWLDTGTYGSLLDAGNFVKAMADRQGQTIGCPNEVAAYKGWIAQSRLATGPLSEPRLIGDPFAAALPPEAHALLN